jgi:hypothetical protein
LFKRFQVKIKWHCNAGHHQLVDCPNSPKKGELKRQDPKWTNSNSSSFKDSPFEKEKKIKLNKSQESSYLPPPHQVSQKELSLGL